ncbi:type I-B CRISPR-associated protein Cas7/Cst2/DevR [Anaerovorax sp. IOR16]|uniref:type I-B CRISPR-associated protein Cas7/Cst2/DevR n=1 Tax=Anaerovorax sp. IOR16 TaxID=2773458 RepID=UPI0019D15557|nr:type I-B CRISPR-associated protein Cas7/Cst2/DevR [Anaerovorax sp. IOR16]
MSKKALTMTVVAHMTSNYSEGLGNIASVQKVFKKGKVYSMRSRESLKNAIMVQSGMYDDLETEVDGATQKLANEEKNATNIKALEGGYMSTSGITYVRNSSFYLTDAISTEPFVNETRFHNNLYLAANRAKAEGISVQEDSKKAGLMPYQYEYDKSLKVYSLTIDLTKIGVDENFETKEASAQEKADRVIALLEGVQHLSLIVKGNLDNAEPIFIVGGLSERKTHYFENLIQVKQNNLQISADLITRIQEGFQVGLLNGMNLDNEKEIITELNPVSVTEFFDQLKQQVREYYKI